MTLQAKETVRRESTRIQGKKTERTFLAYCGPRSRTIAVNVLDLDRHSTYRLFWLKITGIEEGRVLEMDSKRQPKWHGCYCIQFEHIVPRWVAIILNDDTFACTSIYSQSDVSGGLGTCHDGKTELVSFI